MSKIGVKHLRFEQFPVKLFFRLLERGDDVAERVIGPKWQKFKQKWEETNPTPQSNRVLDEQKTTFLFLSRAQMGILAAKWLQFTSADVSEYFREYGLPWSDDPIELLELLNSYIEKNVTKYNLGLSKLESTKEEFDKAPESEFSVETAIASLNLAGFTISDSDKLTIGDFLSMNKALNNKNKAA